MSDTHITRPLFDQVMVPNYAPLEMIPVRGEGSRVWDQEDNENIDLTGGIAVNALGHAHPELITALTEQAQKLWHVSNIYTNEPALRLAQKLVDNTTYSDGFGPKPADITHLEYNDLNELEKVISDKTCAVILEPLQGEGGVLPISPEFAQGVRALCDKHNALMIFDEVQTGMGRTGELFAYMGLNIIPDVVTSAKALGAGFPIAAMLTKTCFAEHLKVGTHGTTFGGNPLACAVAGKAFELIKTFFLASAEEGLLILVAGANVLRFAPALNISDELIEQAMLKLKQAAKNIVNKET